MKRSMKLGGLAAAFVAGTFAGVSLLGTSGASTGSPQFGAAPVFNATPAALGEASKAAPSVSDADLASAIEATKLCVRDAVGALGRDRGWSVDVTFPDTAKIAEGDGDQVAFEWSFNIPGVPQDDSPDLESFKFAANVAQISCQQKQLDSVASAVRAHRRADVERLNGAAARAGRCLVDNRSLGLSDSDARVLIRSIATNQRPRKELADRVNRSAEMKDGVLTCMADASILLPEGMPQK